MSWLEHHRTSEQFASQAEAAVNDGRQQDARALYSRAAKAEGTALQELDGSKARTLGASAVSAVSLHYKAEEFDHAREQALRWLKHDSMPEFAADQLRGLLRTSSRKGEWAGPDCAIGRYIRAESGRAIEAYRAQPARVEEDARYEREARGEQPVDGWGF